LVSIGWTYRALGDELGVKSSQIGRWIHRQQKIQPVNAENVLMLFDRLQMKLQPSDPEYKTLRAALPPPMAWDEETIDDPRANPAEWKRPAHALNRAEDIARDAAELMSYGESPEGAAARLGVTVGSMQTAIRRAAVRAERSA
jgi:DNA-directed RNA polymerase specialized sigma24 family protein